MFQEIENITRRIQNKIWNLYYHIIGGFSKKEKNVIVSMFHHISDEKLPEVDISCKCTINEFETILQYMKSVSIMSMSDFYRMVVEDNFQSSFVITFDDVTADFYHNAYPILKKNNIPFTVFIATGLLNTPDYITTENLKELSSCSLCTIGAHTINHLPLKNVKKHWEFEIVEGANQLERITGNPVEYFAYPYGTPFAISNKVIKYLRRRNRFKLAFIAVPGLANTYSCRNRYKIPRIHNNNLAKYISKI